MQYILIASFMGLLCGDYWGHIPWVYNLHPALSGAAGIMVFLLMPGNNVLVTHDPMAHKLLAALSIQLRGGKPPLEELKNHEDEDLDVYRH